MTDTTAFVAGCATTGVAVLVLLLARVGFQTSSSKAEQSMPASLETVVPVPQTPVQSVSDGGINDDVKQELDRQRDLTAKLENQLVQQEMLARNLENQLKQQQEETRAVLSQLREYQRSVDTLSVQNGQLAAAQSVRDTASNNNSVQTTLLWIGGGLLLVMVLGGGAIILCMILVSGRRREDRAAAPVIYPFQIPVPPAGYRYYEQEFLPPPPVRHKRANPAYYDVD
ncbi:MAG: hypothetical protein KTR27_18690 [Leptolyngbyaceae cyanobacterium MAG.088]|nr:hypothetical protein [Leptolyngbyaceae cyanobacterium MAG.088]